jgi:hypothetical protein
MTALVNPNDHGQQVGADHYETPYQHWDFVQKVLQGRYLEGCATKYPTRWRKKDGLKDLRKSVHYINKLIFEITQDRSKFKWPWYHRAKHLMPLFALSQDYLQTREEIFLFCQANGLGLEDEETRVMLLLGTWRSTVDLESAREIIERMITCEEQRLDSLYLSAESEHD